MMRTAVLRERMKLQAASQTTIHAATPEQSDEPRAKVGARRCPGAFA
jgi:hypothetical protein